MCGIFGYIGSNTQAAKLVLDGLKRLEYRGYDSYGVAVVPTNGNKIVVQKEVGKIGNASVDALPEGSLAFGHTRWATHGGVTKENAHPHLDCEGKIALIHNGVVENYDTIKKRLVSLGHHFISETDTEVIVHLIEEYTQTESFTQAVRKAFLELEGLNAIIAINTADRMLVAARNGSPLVLGFGLNENYLASDPSALLPHTKDVYFLEDQEMAILTENNVEVRLIARNVKKEFEHQELTWDVSETDKGNYAHYMLKEMHEQPAIIAAIAQNATTTTKDIASFLTHAKDVYCIGCGSASHACQVGYYLFSTVADIHLNWAFGSEFSYTLPFLSKDTALLALSQSGETMDILEPLKKAKAKGASIIALVNVLGSSLYRLADKKMLLTAGPERAVASTKALTAKMAHLVLLAFAAAGRFEEGKDLVRKAAQASTQVLLDASIEQIKILAAQLKDKNHLYCLGRGLSYPISLEAALKIKEISYIHAEGLASGELKHGTLALIEKGTPCVVFLPNDETYAANLASAMEVKARGGYVIGISFQENEVFDSYIHVDDCQEATCIPNTIVAQLLAYYLTLERNLDPDMPRNLAKSVTVR